MRPGTSARQIIGRHHPLLKRLRAMVRSGSLLDSGENAGEVLLETPNLIEDAIRSGVSITAVLIRADASAVARGLLTKMAPGVKRYEVEPILFPELTSTEHNPGIIALASAPVWKQQDLFAGRLPLILVLAGIQDPGNLGTILRAAEAFGASGVLATKGTVSPFNAKSVRAASGTLFRLPIVSGLTTPQVVSLLRREKVALLSSVARGGKLLAEVEVVKPVALALGAEGAGLPRDLELAGIPVSIPMARPVESLNVAAAAAIFLYEIARQRHAASGQPKGE
ncbi:MAG: RNA methyltransferase [Acidobacteria bacterium]|nr:RNA methyltransferase [Acidobacteriota bacterium]